MNHNPEVPPVVTIHIYKPETKVARTHTPTSGCAMMMTVVRMPDGYQPWVEQRLLEPHEMHCPYNPEWLAEHLAVIWRQVGNTLLKQLPDIYTIDTPSSELCEQIKALYDVTDDADEDDEEEIEEDAK